MPDPLTVASGVSAAGALVSVWQLRRRALQAEAELEHLQAELAAERHAASHDPLTGLPNRRAFYRLAAALLTDAGGQPLIAVVLDLNDFKQVNDRFGHAAGDQVLVSVAQRLAAFAGDNLVARLGGDEFAGLLASPSVDRRWIDHATRRLCEAWPPPSRWARAASGSPPRSGSPRSPAPPNWPTRCAGPTPRCTGRRASPAVSHPGNCSTRPASPSAEAHRRSAGRTTAAGRSGGRARSAPAVTGPQRLADPVEATPVQHRALPADAVLPHGEHPVQAYPTGSGVAVPLPGPSASQCR